MVKTITASSPQTMMSCTSSSIRPASWRGCLAPARVDAAPSSAAAQRRANEAAARLSRAQSELSRVTDRVSELRVRTAQAKGRLVKLVAGAKAAAVGQYVDGGLPAPILVGRDLVQ